MSTWTLIQRNLGRNRLRTILTTLSENFGDKVQITSGLDGGEVLVMFGPENLRKGMRVNIAEQNTLEKDNSDG